MNFVNEIVLVRGNEIFTTSLAISEGVKIEHDNVVKLIKRYSYIDILSVFETRDHKTKGRPLSVIYLTELQATFLITLMKNSEKVIEFKSSLTKAFFKQRKILQQILTQQHNADWLLHRNDTKIMRRECTDKIQEFIQYAISQGSKSAEKYYMSLSRMELTGLFLLEQKYPNARDVMNFKRLNLIEMADEAIAISLEESMKIGLPYKECYQKAKEKIELLAKIFPKSPLPTLLEETKSKHVEKLAE